jgi:hypothetical protein
VQNAPNHQPFEQASAEKIAIHCGLLDELDAFVINLSLVEPKVAPRIELNVLKKQSSQSAQPLWR